MWLGSLGPDVLAVCKLLRTEAPPALKEPIIGALSYVLESKDLIPDGLSDLGYMDSAFVLRVASGQLPSSHRDSSEVLQRLSVDVPLINEFLGSSSSERMHRFVQGLPTLEVRKRTASKTGASPEMLEQFSEEISAWVSAYQVPEFAKDDKFLVKLRSFMATKLPS